MQSYTLKQTHNQYEEVFAKASVEPVLVTQQMQPSHVILSAEAYQRLIARLEELEDAALGEAATVALTQSSMVGSEEFTTTLEMLADG